jgi:hypothetical protein
MKEARTYTHYTDQQMRTAAVDTYKLHQPLPDSARPLILKIDNSVTPTASKPRQGLLNTN